MRKIIPQKFYYVIAPGALTGFSCRAPENNSKIIFPACNHFDSEGTEKRSAKYVEMDGINQQLGDAPEQFKSRYV